MFANFIPSDLPFKLDSTEKAKNTEKRLKCFFIENPATKTMEKDLMVKIEPKQTRQFLVILTASINVQKANIVSKLYLHHIQEGDPAKVIEKRISDGGKISKHAVNVNKTMEVLLCGKHQNPTVIC